MKESKRLKYKSFLENNKTNKIGSQEKEDEKNSRENEEEECQNNKQEEYKKEKNDADNNIKSNYIGKKSINLFKKKLRALREENPLKSVAQKIFKESLRKNKEKMKKEINNITFEKEMNNGENFNKKNEYLINTKNNEIKKNKEDNNKKIEQPKYREIIKEKEKESKQNIIKYRMISPEQIKQKQIKEINQPEQKEEANDVKPTKGRIFSYYQNRKKLSKIEQNSSMKNDSNNIPTTNNNNNIISKPINDINQNKTKENRYIRNYIIPNTNELNKNYNNSNIVESKYSKNIYDKEISPPKPKQNIININANINKYSNYRRNIPNSPKEITRRKNYTFQNNKKTEKGIENQEKPKVKREYKTFTYKSSNRDPNNTGSIIITSSRMNEDKNIHHMISVREPLQKSNSISRYECRKNKYITIISSTENIEPDKNKNNEDIVTYDNNNSESLGNNNNKNTFVGIKYVTNFNIRKNGYTNTDPNLGEKEKNKTFTNENNYRNIPTDNKKNSNNSNINKTYNSNNPNNKPSNQNSNNPSNVHVSSYITRRNKNYNKEYQNKTTDTKYKSNIQYNTVDNDRMNINKDAKNNNEIKTTKEIIDINNKPDKNKANNISFTSSNASKNQQDPNKEKNDQPIVHNTRIYLTKRRPSNKNVDDNIQIKEIKNETKTTTNENKNENKNDNEIKNKYRYNRYNRYKEEVKDTKKTIYSLEEKNNDKNLNQDDNIIKRKEIKKELEPIINTDNINNNYNNKILVEKMVTSDKIKENKSEPTLDNNIKINEKDDNINLNEEKDVKEDKNIDENINTNENININKEKNIDENININEDKDIKEDKNVNENINENMNINTDNSIKEEKNEDKKLNIEQEVENIINNITNNINTENVESEKKENNYDFLNEYSSLLNINNLIKDKIDIPSMNIYPEINYYDKYDYLNNLGLSEDTKAYLSSYSTSVRPELNDYTKTYLDSLNDTSADAKPELTNLTKEYLSLNTVTEDKKEEENKENDLVIKEEEC